MQLIDLEQRPQRGRPIGSGTVGRSARFDGTVGRPVGQRRGRRPDP